MKYKVAIAGWSYVEVEANSADEARELVREETPDMAGDLYDLEVHDAVPVEDIDE